MVGVAGDATDNVDIVVDADIGGEVKRDEVISVVREEVEFGGKMTGDDRTFDLTLCSKQSAFIPIKTIGMSTS